MKPMVFAGLYPVESHEHGLLRDALEKLRLNDSALQLRAGELRRAGLRLPLRLPRPAAPGNRPGAAGARVQHRPDHDRAGRALSRDARLRREWSRSTTRPSGPTRVEIVEIEEPIIEATVITPRGFVGEILKLLEEKRGDQKKFEHLGGARVMLVYEMPLNEIVLDFYDRLEVGIARLRLARLPPGRLSRVATW